MAAFDEKWSEVVNIGACPHQVDQRHGEAEREISRRPFPHETPQSPDCEKDCNRRRQEIGGRAPLDAKKCATAPCSVSIELTGTPAPRMAGSSWFEKIVSRTGIVP